LTPKPCAKFTLNLATLGSGKAWVIGTRGRRLQFCHPQKSWGAWFPLITPFLMPFLLPPHCATEIETDISIEQSRSEQI